MISGRAARELGLPAGAMCWVVLRHFLSAEHLRALCSVIVEYVSSERLTLKDLFREEVGLGEDWRQAWIVQPTEDGSPLANALQRLIRSMVWQLDAEMPRSNDLGKDEGRFIEVEHAIRVSSYDLQTPLADLKGASVEPHFGSLLKALAAMQQAPKEVPAGALLEQLALDLSELDIPLKAAVFKHLGDLAADSDHWDRSELLYEHALTLIDNHSPGSSFASLLTSILHQSCAMAAWVRKGPESASLRFATSARQLSFEDFPLFHANASHDAMVALHEADPRDFPQDRRVSVMLPPLLQSTHDTSSALRSWIDGPTYDTPRLFWASLRRQVGLGSTTQSRITKAAYARSLIDSLESQVARGRSAAALFQLAVNLFIESTLTEQVRLGRWSQRLVSMYVTEEIVTHVVQVALRHPGAVERRRRVVIELMGAWLQLISPRQADVAEKMVTHMAGEACAGGTSVLSTLNSAGRSFELLLEAAAKSSWLTSLAPDAVATAVMAKLDESTFWAAKEKAIRVATVFGGAFRNSDLSNIIKCVLDSAHGTEVASPISGAILGFLYSSPARALLQESSSSLQLAVDVVLRFNDGVVQTIDVLQFLKGFDASLLKEPEVARHLHEPVRKLRAAARQSNTSAAVGAICALLMVPAIAGAAGIDDAFAGLDGILSGVGSRPSSFLLPYAYDPVLVVSQQWRQIADASGISDGKLRIRINALCSGVNEIWLRAAQSPRVFAPFSIPEADLPDSAIVHNWTVASLSLAREFGDDAIDRSISDASASQSALRESVEQGRRTSARMEASRALGRLDPKNESEQTFYSQLGGRLLLIAQLDGSDADVAYSDLLTGCLEFGPRGVDAAVLVHWVTRSVPASIQPSLKGYFARVEGNPEMRELLGPLLDRLASAVG